MLFSNALLLAIASATVSAELNFNWDLPEGWVQVERREEPSNKVWDRLFARNQQASQTSSSAPKPTPQPKPKPTTTTTQQPIQPTTILTQSDPTTSKLSPSTTTLLPSTTSGGSYIDTTTEYIATTCFTDGLCSTTTLIVAYQTEVSPK